MEPCDQGLFLVGGNRFAETLRAELMPHAFLAAADLQHVMVLWDVPVNVEPKTLERPVESDPMAVPFRIDDHPVLVKEVALISGILVAHGN